MSTALDVSKVDRNGRRPGRPSPLSFCWKWRHWCETMLWHRFYYFPLSLSLSQSRTSSKSRTRDATVCELERLSSGHSRQWVTSALLLSLSRCLIGYIAYLSIDAVALLPPFEESDSTKSDGSVISVNENWNGNTCRWRKSSWFYIKWISLALLLLLLLSSSSLCFSRPVAQNRSRHLNIVLRKVWLQRCLIRALLFCLELAYIQDCAGQ